MVLRRGAQSVFDCLFVSAIVVPQADRRFQSRLQDLRDRLEQSESTNRSLQNYVHFLKASYANVFGDSALTSSTLRPPSPI